MADAKSIIGGVLLLVIVIGMTYLILGVTYSTKNVTEENDGQAIIPNINTFLCQAYLIKTHQAADMYLLRHPVKLSKSYDTVVSQNYIFPISLDSKKFFFLVKGSHIKVRLCRHRVPLLFRRKVDAPQEKVELRLYRGEDCNSPKYRSYDRCREVIQPVSDCGSKPTVFNYDVPQTNKYFITVSENIKADVEVKRSLFATRGAKQRCLVRRSCRLETSGSVDIVIVFSDKRNNTSYTKTCEKRSKGWFGVGAIIVGIILLIVLAVATIC